MAKKPKKQAVAPKLRKTHTSEPKQQYFANQQKKASRAKFQKSKNKKLTLLTFLYLFSIFQLKR